MPKASTAVPIRTSNPPGWTISAAVSATAMVGLLSHPGLGQCLEWSEDFGLPGVDHQATTFEVWDDGTGPALYIGGDFEAAGPLKTTNVVRFDGSQWTRLGNGLPDPNKWGPLRVNDLIPFDDGSGEMLYAGGNLGSFAGVMRWDGTSWTEVGNSPTEVTALESFDAGNGPVLYAGTDWGSTKGTLTRWNGAQWEQIPAWGTSFSSVDDIEVYDDGTGPSLYAAGLFSIATGYPADRITRYDGTIFYQLPPLPSGNTFYDMEVHDDGSGPELYCATSGGLYSWNGAQWTDAGIGLNVSIRALLSFDDGAGYGARLYVGSIAGAVQRLDGSSWTSLGGGGVVGLGSFDDGSGPRLYSGKSGTSKLGSTLASGVARHDGNAWSALFDGRGSDGTVTSAVVFDHGQGPMLYANVGLETAYNQVHVWTGTGWSMVGTPADGPISDLEVYDDGSGPELYARGAFTQIDGVPAEGLARWNGTSWSAVGAGLTNGADMTVWNRSGGAVLAIAGGSMAGGQPTDGLAIWNGSSFETFANGTTFELSGGGIAFVSVICAYDSGSGEELYIGGRFDTISGTTVNNVARWNGTTWSALGAGAEDRVMDLMTYDDGTGEKLVVGGDFEGVDGQLWAYLAAWDGTAWSSVGAGDELPQQVTAMTAFDDGQGDALWVASTGQDPGTLHKWNGTSWATPPLEGFDGGLSNSSASVLVPFDDGRGNGAPSLFAFGSFRFVGTTAASRVARLDRACPCPPAYYCTAGVSASGCQARIQATGTPSATLSSGFVLTVDNLEGSKDGLFFYGTNGRQANPWGNGGHYVCVVPPRVRGGLLTGGGTPGQCDGILSQDLNARWCSTCPRPGHNPGAGTLVQAQLWYRDPLNTSNVSSGMSNAVEFVVCP